MKSIYTFLIISFFTITACGGDEDEAENTKPTNAELSIEPYFKYVGLSLDEIQRYFSVPLEDNVKNFYARNQWIYNQVSNQSCLRDDLEKIQSQNKILF